MEKDGLSLKYASKRLRNDRDVVITAINENPLALEYASNNLKNDKIIIWNVVESNGLLLHLASEELRNDKDIVLPAVKQNGLALKYASKIFNKSSLKGYYHDLQFDMDIVIEAVKNNGHSLIYVPDRLKRNKKIMNIALKNIYFIDYFKLKSRGIARYHDYLFDSIFLELSFVSILRFY